MEKQNVSVRKWWLSDAEDLAAALNAKSVQDNLRDGLPFPYTKKDAEAFISFALSADPNEHFMFAVTLDGRAVGSVGVSRMGNIHRFTAELGYYLAEPYWNRGIMSQAVQKVCGIVFAQSDIVRIFAEPFSRNTASCRVLEKCGFVCEGTLRANAVKNGKTEDMKMYSLLREEFDGSRNG